MFAKAGDKAKAKREERAKAKAAKKGVPAGGEGLFTPDPTEQKAEASSSNSKSKSKLDTTTSTAKGKQQPSPGYFHTVPSLPFELPTATSTTIAKEKSISKIPNPLFPYPGTAQQTANLQTFQSLSSLSYRMGLGPRFGGEYLIYPGDYLRYHAHFTSQVVREDEYIEPMEIVAWGRLGTGTKKAGLICCVTSGRPEPGQGRSKRDEGDVDHEVTDNGEKGGVEFYSLEWANFG